MNNKKIIIRNCPACHNYYSNIYECHQMEDCDDNSCSSCTDCVLKQIVDECKEETEIDIDLRGDLAERVMSKFDIQEVE